MAVRTIRVLFDVVKEYYWPAMASVYEEYRTDPRYEVFVKVGPNQDRFLGIFLFSRRRHFATRYAAMGCSLTQSNLGFDIVFCGDTLKSPARYGDALLVNLDHGPCFKTLRYRNLLKQADTKYMVCAEGEYRVGKLKEWNLIDREIVRVVGFPKLDPFFNGAYSRDDIVARHGLDPTKPIVLYAPTYKPTSIFEIARALPGILGNYSVLVKLHPYSWNGKYAPHEQHRVFERLAKDYPNLHLVDPVYHDIMPYLFAADTMISEASSVINEFLSLGRCGIIYDLPDEALTHSDGMPLLEEKTSEWLKDACVHISQADGLSRAVAEALEPTAARREHIRIAKEWMYAFTDGRSAQRVKKVVEEEIEKRGMF